MSAFKLWMKEAKPSEQIELAEDIGTSREYLYQISGGFKAVSAARGGEIERATQRMNVETEGRLPLVFRTDLVKACHSCEYARKCLPEHFPDDVDGEGSEL